MYHRRGRPGRRLPRRVPVRQGCEVHGIKPRASLFNTPRGDHLDEEMSFDEPECPADSAPLRAYHRTLHDKAVMKSWSHLLQQAAPPVADTLTDHR